MHNTALINTLKTFSKQELKEFGMFIKFFILISMKSIWIKKHYTISHSERWYMMTVL